MGDQISEMAERAAARCAIFLLLALVCTATGSGLADESVVVLDSSETDARGGSTKPESAADKSAKKELSEAKPGSSKQVLKMILKEAKKLPMTAAQRKEWEASGMDKAAKNIAAGEVKVQDVDKLVKMVEKKQEAEAEKRKAAGKKKSDATEEEAPADQVYLQAIENTLKKAGLKMTELERKAFEAKTAAKLARKEKGDDYVTTLHSGAVKRLEKRAAALQKDLDEKNAGLKRVKAQVVQERQNKASLMADGKSTGETEATTVSDLTRAEELSNDAKEAARVNAATWLQLTQANAQVRKSQSELDQCVIDALKARKSAQNTVHGVNMQTEAVDVSTKKIVALQATPSTSTAETQKNDKDIAELQVLKASSQKALKKAQLQSSAKATAATAKQSECDRKRELLAAHEKLVKKLQREHAAAKYRKQNMVRKAQSMKAEGLEMLASVKRNKAGFNKAVAAATRMNHVVKVVTATHYCAMKQDKETKQWNPESADFAGADTEQGNYLAKLAKACDGKKDCSISVPADNVADCPKTGYVARYSCVAADEKAEVLLELAESGEPDEAAAFDEAAAVAKLSSKLGSVAPEMKENVSNKNEVISEEKVRAQLEALASNKDSAATTEVKMSPGSKDRTVKLSCSSGSAPKKVQEALEALDKAKNEALKDRKELAQAVDTTKANREAQAAKATTNAEQVKAELLQAQKKQAAEDRKAAELAAEKTDLQEKLLQANAKEEPKKEETKKEAITKEIAQVAAKEKNADEEMKADESKTEKLKAEKEAVDAKEVKAKEKAQDGSKDQKQKESPKVKKLETQLKHTEDVVQIAAKDVQKTKSEITKSNDRAQIIALAGKVESQNKALGVAQKSVEKVKDDLKQAKTGESRQQGASNEEKVEKANGDVGGIKAKIVALNVKKAAASSSEKASLDGQLARDKKILEGDEKKLAQATAQNNDKEGTQAKQAKDDAVDEVEVAKAKVAALDKQLVQTKQEMTSAIGGQVVKVSGEIGQQAAVLKESRNDLAKAEAAEVKALDKEDTKTGNDEQQEQKDNNKVLEAEDKVNKLKKDLQTTSHPSDVEHKANELKNAEVEEKKDIQEMAADKAKVKIDQNTEETEETSEKKAKKDVRKVAKKEELPDSASVRKAEEKLQAADVLQKADGVQTAKTISQAVEEANERMQALENNAEMGVKKTTDQLGKVAEMISTLKKQAKEGSQGASKLAQVKKNIMAGLPAISVVVPKPSKPRTKEEKKAALILISGTSPDAAVCKKGQSCCVIGYTDKACKQQKGEFCSTASNTEAEKWRPMLQMNTKIGDAKEATLDVRWEKDLSKGLKNEGDVLRLRACGTFKKSEGHSCYPKDGVGLRFGNLFSTPAGQCLRAADLAMPKASAEMNKALSKLIVESASSKQNEASKVDTAGKKLDQKAEKKEQERAAIKIAVMPKTEALDDLVLLLMDMDSGDFLDESKAKALFEITGSFSFRLKK